MLIQLSAGQGPTECQYAVWCLYNALQKEYNDIRLVDYNRVKSNRYDCYRSIMFTTEEDLSELEGTIQCIFKSPFRRNHKRKNWFVDVSIIPEVEDSEEMIENVTIKTFRCGSNGGQNVNKVETGVELRMEPQGYVVRCTSERTQFDNLRLAFAKLSALLYNKEQQAKAKQKNDAWKEHYKIVRGNPVRTYDWSK